MQPSLWGDWTARPYAPGYQVEVDTDLGPFEVRLYQLSYRKASSATWNVSISLQRELCLGDRDLQTVDLEEAKAKVLPLVEQAAREMQDNRRRHAQVSANRASHREDSAAWHTRLYAEGWRHCPICDADLPTADRQNGMGDGDTAAC